MTSSPSSMSQPRHLATPRGRILCVDDEPNVLRALNSLLRRDFDVATATSGLEGLRQVHESGFNVVISDQRMPGISGVDFLREVRRIAPRSVRILLTACADMQTIRRSVDESEIFRCINKPWNVSELPRVIAQAVEISRALPEGDPEPQEDGAPAACTVRILVLDDNPEIHAQVELAIGDHAEVLHTNSMLDALQRLQKGRISIFVTGTRIGTVDSKRLIRLLGQRHPEIVTVVLAEETGAEPICSLNSQSHIYGFVPKPIQSGYLKTVLRSAIARHPQLRQDPILFRRHQFEAVSNSGAQTCAADLDTTYPLNLTTTQTLRRYGGFSGHLFAH